MTKKQAIQLFSLDNSTLRFHDVPGFQFAAHWHYLPVHYQEAVLLSQALPLVFRRNPAGALELDILLSRKGRHIIQQGQWPINVQPTLLAMYPFTWASIGKKEARLAYYPDAEHFNGPGQKLITSKNKPTQKLRHYLTQLQKVQAAFNATVQVLEELDKHELLTENGNYLLLTKQPEQAVLDQLSPALKKLLQAHINSLQHLTVQTPAASQPKPTEKVDPPVSKEKAKKKKDASKKKAKAADGSKAEKEKKKAKEASGKKKAPAKKKTKAKKESGLESIIHQVCDTFSVNIEELKGRKRSGRLTEARIKLAEESKQSGLLEPMAEWLQRSPATLNSWLR